METRLLAIMLTDMAGYTAYSARADRSGLDASIRAQQRIITAALNEYRGRLVKWIGDAALAVFNSATDAILCGHSIQVHFLEEAERGTNAINPNIKVIVHVGDINLDADGDIYGDPVNLAARIEKAASPDEVYFSESTRRVIRRAEIPHEFVGEFEFKGIADATPIYRTCFGQSPVVRERVLLAQTNFVGVQALADEHGWDTIHPVLDDATGSIVEVTRAAAGTTRSIGSTGCLVTFRSLASTLEALVGWYERLETLKPAANVPVQLRTAVHLGTVHIMKYTTMGRDIDIVRTLAPLGFGQEVLVTAPVVEAAAEDDRASFVPVLAERLRSCTSRTRWINRFNDVEIHRLELQVLRQRSKTEASA